MRPKLFEISNMKDDPIICIGIFRNKTSDKEVRLYFDVRNKEWSITDYQYIWLSIKYLSKYHLHIPEDDLTFLILKYGH